MINRVSLRQSNFAKHNVIIDHDFLCFISHRWSNSLWKLATGSENEVEVLFLFRNAPCAAQQSGEYFPKSTRDRKKISTARGCVPKISLCSSRKFSKLWKSDSFVPPQSFQNRVNQIFDPRKFSESWKPDPQKIIKIEIFTPENFQNHENRIFDKSFCCPRKFSNRKNQIFDQSFCCLRKFSNHENRIFDPRQFSKSCWPRGKRVIKNLISQFWKFSEHSLSPLTFSCDF